MSRFDYIKYDDDAVDMQKRAKTECTDVEDLITLLNPGRAQSLALTKLEEVYMWIGKAIRDDQVSRAKAEGKGVALMENRKDG